MTGGPPDTVIDTQPSALTNQRSFSFTFHGTPAADASPSATIEFNCSLDGATPDRCTSPVPVNVNDGDHTFQVTALTEGVADESPATATWHVDSTPPDTTITSGPPSFDNSTTATITFTGAPTADIAKFECSLDAAAFATCTSPVMLDSLTSGLHQFQARAVDAAGNADPTPAQHSWTLDTSTPDTMITAGPAAGAVTNGSATFGFTSGLATAVFECSFDNGSFTACVSPIAYNSLPGGMHTFTVRAKNPTTNVVDPTPAARMWVVDATPPVVAITSHPIDPTKIATPMFVFSSADTDVAMFECQIDGVQAFATCTSPFTGTALSDGLQTFRVRATDNVGNQGTAIFSWTIDTAAPTVTITSGPSGTIGTTSATFTFSTAGTPSSVQCQLDAGPFAACTSPANLTGLTDGAHTFTIRATDAAGNIGTTSRMFSVTTIGPTVTITSGPNGPTNINTPMFTFTTMNATTIDCRFDGGTFSSCTSPFTAQALGEGLHTFEVRVRDVALNQGTAMRSFTVDTLAPTVTITTGPSGPTNNPAPSFTFIANGSPTLTECRFDAAAFAACSSPFVTSPALAQGAHVFEVRVTDAAGNTGNDTRAFNVVTTGPSVTITGGPSGPTNDNTPAWTFTTANNPTTVQCKLDAAPFAACTSPFQAPQLADGSHMFTVQVSDAANNTNSDSRTIALDTVAPTVTITGGPSGPTNVQQPSFTFSTAGSPSAITCAMDSGTAATCVSPFTQATNLADGPHVFTVTVADVAGNTSNATRSFVVNTAGPTVTITNGTPDPTDNTPTFTFTTTGSPTTIECRIDSGTFSACTSPFTSTPLGGGAHTFSVRVADTAGNSDTKSQSFTINSTAPNVAITAGPNGACPTGGGVTCNPTNDSTPSFAFTVGTGWTTIQCHTDSNPFVDCSQGLTAGQAGTGAFTAQVVLGSGGHSFEVQACNASSNCASDIKAFTVDTTPPTISITAGPSGLCPTGSGGTTCDPTSPNMPTFTYASAGGATTFECATIAGPGPATAFGPCGSTTSFTTNALAPDGQFTFSVRVTDSAFNQNTASKTFVVDVTPPAIVLAAPFLATMPSGVTSTTPLAGFSATDTHLQAVQCSVDGGAFGACTSGSSFQASSALAEGTHHYTVKATDTAGNSTTFDLPTFIVDHTAPTVTISDPTVHGTVTADTNLSQPTLTVTVTDTNGGPNLTATPVTTTCSFNGTANNCTIVGSLPGTVTIKPSGSLPDGSTTLSITSTDAATPTGNTTTVVKTFFIDTHAPTLGTLAVTGTPTRTIPTLTFMPADVAPSSGILSVTCDVDGTQSTSCTGGSYTPTSLSGDGTHQFNITAIDNAGSVTSGSITFFFDTTPPAISALTPPAGGTLTLTNLATPSYAFTVTNPGAGPGAITTVCDFDGTAASCPFVNTTTPIQVSATLTEGTHTLHISATDAAGNAATTSQTFFVDLTPPVVTITAPVEGDILNNSKPTLTFTVTDTHATDSTSYTCSVDGGVAVACPTLTFTPSSNLSDGPHFYTIVAKDLAHNLATTPSSTLVVNFDVDTTSPIVTVDSGPSNGSTINMKGPTFGFSVNGTHLDTSSTGASCDPGTGTFGACTSYSVTSGTGHGTLVLSGLTEGSHTVQFEGTNKAKPPKTGPPTSVTFTVDTVPPTISAVSPSGLINSASPAVTVTATDTTSPTGISFTCKLDMAASFTTCPASLSGLSEGMHTLLVNAMDTAGNTTASPFMTTFTVDTMPPAITISAPAANGSLQTASPVSFTFSATDATMSPAIAFTCALDMASFTACASPQSVAVATDGPHTFHVKATDGAGNVTQASTDRTFTLDTTAPGSATISGSDTDVVKTLSTYTYSATDAGSAMTAVCKLNGTAQACTSVTPGGSAGAFTFSGTFLPTGATQGSNTITVEITDGASHTTTLTRIVKFDSVAPTVAFANSDGTINCSSGSATVTNASKPITVTISDATTSVASSSCSIPMANGTCVGTASPYTLALTMLMGTVTVMATDAVGNVLNQTCALTATAAVVITGGPRGPTNDRSASYTFEMTDLAAAQGATAECSYDGTAFGACTTATTYVVAKPVPGKLHTFEVRAKTAKGALGGDKVSFELDPIAMCLDGEKQLGKTDLVALLDKQTASTIEFWYRSHSAVPVFDLFTISTPGGASAALRYDADIGFELALATSTALRARAKPMVTTFASSTTLSLQQWHHYALTLSAKSAQLFIDGAAVTGTRPSGTLPTLSEIASDPREVAFDLTAPGAFLDLRISNGARYAQTFAPTFPLVADKTTTVLFPMNEATGSSSSEIRDTAPEVLWSAPTTRWLTCVAPK